MNFARAAAFFASRAGFVAGFWSTGLSVGPSGGLETGGVTTGAGVGVGAAGVPDGVKDLICTRLARLGETANQLLTFASVIGR